MHKTLYLFSLLALASARPVSAQTIYHSIETSAGGKYNLPATAPLHILLPVVPSPDVLAKKYKNPADRDGYVSEVAAKRTALEAAAKHWHLSPVSFVSAAEYAQLEQDKEQAHLMLDIGTVPIAKYNGRHEVVYQMPGLSVYLLGNVKAGINLLTVGHPTSVILAYQLYYPFDRRPWQQAYHASDVVAGVQQLQAYISQRAQAQSPRDIKQAAEAGLGKSAELLPGKTLLITGEQLLDGAPESKLAQLYPYPLLVTDQATLDAAVASADSRYVYIRYVTIESNNGYQLLDASTGKVLGYSIFHASSSHDIGHVQAADFKQLVKTATKP